MKHLSWGGHRDVWAEAEWRQGVRLVLTGKNFWVGGGGLEEHAGSQSGWDSGSPQEMMATKSGKQPELRFSHRKNSGFSSKCDEKPLGFGRGSNTGWDLKWPHMLSWGGKECKKGQHGRRLSQNRQICRRSRKQCYVDGKILRDCGGQEVSIQRWIGYGIEKESSLTTKHLA